MASQISLLERNRILSMHAHAGRGGERERERERRRSESEAGEGENRVMGQQGKGCRARDFSIKQKQSSHILNFLT